MIIVGGGSMIPMRLIALQVSRRPPGMCIYITRIMVSVHEFLFSKGFKALRSEYEPGLCLVVRTRDRNLGSKEQTESARIALLWTTISFLRCDILFALPLDGLPLCTTFTLEPAVDTVILGLEETGS